MRLWSKLKQAVARPRATPAGEAPRIDPRHAFRDFAEASLASISGMASVRVAPNEDFALQYRFEGGREGTLYLGNVFHDLREMPPDARVRHLHSMVLAERSVPASLGEATSRLVSVIRGASYVVNAEATLGRLVRREFAPFLFECVALDSPHSIALLTEAQLKVWGGSADAMFEVGHANLRARTVPSDVQSFDREANYSLLHLATDDSYQSSRLALPGWLAGFGSLLEGRPVAAAPERDTLLVTGDANEAALLRLYDSAEREYRASPRSLSPELYTLNDEGRVVRYVPQRGSRAFELGCRARVLLAAEEYATQKHTFEKLDAASWRVAEYNAILREGDGLAFSYCTWARERLTHVPPTDLVVLINGRTPSDAELLSVRFEDLLALAPGCLEPTRDVCPALWRVAGWPSKSEWKALRRKETAVSDLEPCAAAR